MAKLYHDQVALFYEDAGRGAPPLLFIHGLGGDRTCFAPQFEHFRHDHRVVAIDLRGHGQSDAPEQGYSLPELAEELAWMCYELGVYKPVFVGYGLGAMIAVECARRHPSLPAGIAALDAPLPPTSELGACAQGVLEGLSGSSGADALDRAGEGLLWPADDLPRRAQILEGLARIPSYVATALWESACTWDAPAALMGCKAPLLSIATEAPLADLARLRELCPQVVVGNTVGAELVQPSEVQAQVNDLLEGFLHTSVLSRA